MSLLPGQLELTLTDAELKYLEDFLRPVEQRIQELEEENRLDEVPSGYGVFPPDTSVPPRVPYPRNFRTISETTSIGTTHIVASWTEPERVDLVDHYEIWTQNVTGESQELRHLDDFNRAPAAFEVKSDSDVTVVAFLRPVMKDGTSIPALDCPTIAFNVTVTESITAGDIADESIGDAKLDRTTDPIVVGTADIANAAITTAKIGTAQITTALIANLAVGTAQIANAAITDAKILSLSAAKITTGTLSAITISSCTINSSAYTLASGNNQMLIDGTNGFNQVNTSTGFLTKIIDGTITFFNTSGGSIVGGIGAQNSGAQMLLYGSGGSPVVKAYSDAVDLGQANSGYISVANTSSTERVEIGVNSSDEGEIHINGTKVVGVQGASVTAPAGGSTVDSEARTAISTIISRLQAHGLIA